MLLLCRYARHNVEVALMILSRVIDLCPLSNDWPLLDLGLLTPYPFSVLYVVLPPSSSTPSHLVQSLPRSASSYFHVIAFFVI